MLSYHNDPAVKLKYQQRFAKHRELDQVIQGTGFNNGRGCFVGCTLDAYDHSRFPVELSWPEWLAYLADEIFENIPSAEAPQFGTDLLEAVPVGKDLEPVRWKLAALRHRKQLAALADNNEPYAQQVRDALQKVIDFCESEIKDESAAAAAAAAARSAAAWSAARSAAAWSAWSAAESAAASAELSVRSAAASAAASVRSAAASAAWQRERDTLLDILRNGL